MGRWIFYFVFFDFLFMFILMRLLSNYLWNNYHFEYKFPKVIHYTKSSVNIQYSYMRRTISDNWQPLKNHEKGFLFHLSKLNMLLANPILHILCIFIKPNVWYSWSLKILAIKRWFPFNFAKTLQGCHFVVGGPKSFKLLANICFENSLQNTVLPSLLLFFVCLLLSWSRRYSINWSRNFDGP